MKLFSLVTAFVAAHYTNQCAKFSTYLATDDDKIRSLLAPIDRSCAAPWFTDSGSYFVDLVYEEEGYESAAELARMYNHLWYR